MNIPKKADTWVGAMEATSEGMQIVTNLKDEENVPHDVGAAFFEAIADSFDLGEDPDAEMNATLVSMPTSERSGPGRSLGLQLLTRFAPLARLTDTPSLRRAGVSEQMLLADPSLVDKIRELPLGHPRNPRNIVWAATEDPVSADIDGGFGLSETLNKLGIPKAREQDMYQAVYSANDLSEDCHVPTVLDAGANPCFRPAEKDAPSGMTHPCQGGGAGYPEYVHRKCMVTDPRIRVHRI